MQRFCVMAAMCAVAACGGSGNENCDFSKNTGTYKIHWEAQNGNCGDIPDSLVSIQAGDTSDGSACTFSENNQDEADCKVETAFTCNDAADGYVFSYTASLKVTKDDGSELKGPISVTAKYSSTGQLACSGLYTVTYERQ